MTVIDRIEGASKPAAPPPLQQLYDGLAEAIRQEKALGFAVGSDQPAESFERLDIKVQQLVAEYIEQGHEDWHGYCHHYPFHYVRNLVDSNDDFELLVICWDKGQGSRIQDHQNSHGWMAGLDGAVQETRYKMGGAPEEREGGSTPTTMPQLPGVISATSPCPELEELGSTVMQRGSGVIYINSSIALHAMSCAPGANKGVSLHVHAPPITRVRLFEPDSNRVVERKPGFYSMYGVRT